MGLANTPEPPYYAVIFTSIRKNDDPEYLEVTQRMDELAKEQPGFLGAENARDVLGVTVSYWDSLESIRLWKEHTEHKLAQEKGKKDWYKVYKTRIAKVERDYSFES